MTRGREHTLRSTPQRHVRIATCSRLDDGGGDRGRRGDGHVEFFEPGRVLLLQRNFCGAAGIGAVVHRRLKVDEQSGEFIPRSAQDPARGDVPHRVRDGATHRAGTGAYTGTRSPPSK